MTNDVRRVRDIGEFALIERLHDRLGATAIPPRGAIGIGDDAALWTPSPGQSLIVTTDALVDQVHFRLDWTDWQSLGHKALAVNLSDVAAMGARPVLTTVTLGLTGNELVADIERLYDGLAGLALPYNVLIAGGDVAHSPSALSIGVTVIGEVVADRALLRSGARPGDLIAVSGTLGASAAGMLLLEDRERAAGSATADLLIAAHLRPNPRLALGAVLHEAGATAAMDLSDGLLGDLPRLLRASNVGGRVVSEAIPVIPAVRALFPERWRTLALSGGEDYELLFTVPPESWTTVDAAAFAVGATVSSIGSITADPDLMVDGTVAGPGGWDHFHDKTE